MKWRESPFELGRRRSVLEEFGEGGRSECVGERR